MHFDLHLSPQTPGPVDEIFGQLEYAKSIGFTGTWLTDHQFSDYHVFSDPLTMAAAISQRVPGLRIGFAVAVVPLMHPLRFVTQCNLIDQLTKGNFVAGVGPGNSPVEFAGYGIDREVRHEIMQEFLEVCDLAWEPPGKDGFEFHGKHFDIEVSGRISPAPIQRPRPHMAVATHTPARLKEAGRRGSSLLLGIQDVEAVAAHLQSYLEGMDDAALGEEARVRAWKHTSIVRQIYIAADGENWMEELGDVLDTFVRKSMHANTGTAATEADVEQRRKQHMEGNVMYAGTADEVFERLRPFAELGINNLMCWFNFGQMEDERIRASMTRFHEQVMPRLREITSQEGFSRSLIEKTSGTVSGTSARTGSSRIAGL